VKIYRLILEYRSGKQGDQHVLKRLTKIGGIKSKELLHPVLINFMKL